MTISIRLFFLTLFLSIFSTVNCIAQGEVGQAEELEWVEIRKLEKVYEDAVNSNQLGNFAPFVAEDFTGITVTGAPIVGFKGFQEYSEKMRKLIGEGGTYTVDASYKPGILLGSAALAYGSTKEKVTTSDGNVFEYEGLWTAMVVKRDGVWKVLRLHSSMDPLNNPFVQHFGEKKTLTYAASCGVVGLILGCLLSCMIGRCRGKRCAG